MLSPVQNAAVVSWLRNNSKRPMAAMSVWAILFTGLRMDTGEIVLKRDEIETVKVSGPSGVSGAGLAYAGSRRV